MKRYSFLSLLLILIIFYNTAIPSQASWSAPAKNDWTNLEAKGKYKQVALKICESFNPTYLALALGVNSYYDKHPHDFERFVAMYKDIYDIIKSNPKYSHTKIFVTFQLEKMKGLGAVIGNSGKTQWDILRQFDGKLDLLVFTTFPEVEYSKPEEIPVDYYSSIYDHIPANLKDKKIAFAEIGWNSENLLPVTGNNNTHQSQVHFIDRFAHVINSLKDSGKIEFVCWTMMHDMKDTGSYHPLRTIGLRDCHGEPKDANDSVWKMWFSFYQFESPVFKVGIGPIPRNFPGASAADWLDMYKNAPTIASLILAQTDWFDTPQKAGEIPRFFKDLQIAKAFHHLDCIYGINFFDQGNGEAKISTQGTIFKPFLIVIFIILIVAVTIFCVVKNYFSYLRHTITNSINYIFHQKSDVLDQRDFNVSENTQKEKYFLEKGLSFREQEVLEYLIQGQSYKEIAVILNISIETVKKHASNIYRKTNTTSKSELKADIWNYQ